MWVSVMQWVKCYVWCGGDIFLFCLEWLRRWLGKEKVGVEFYGGDGSGGGWWAGRGGDGGCQGVV